MSASLLSDMESFKAANPNGKLEDFIRWYSPRDWIEDNQAKVDGKHFFALAVSELMDKQYILRFNSKWYIDPSYKHVDCLQMMRTAAKTRAKRK